MYFPTFVQNLIQELRNWQRRRDAIRQLTHFDDHLLRDIGIEHQDIRQYVNGMLPPRCPGRDVMQNRSVPEPENPVLVKEYQKHVADCDPIRQIALGPAVMYAAATGRNHDCA